MPEDIISDTILRVEPLCKNAVLVQQPKLLQLLNHNYLLLSLFSVLEDFESMKRVIWINIYMRFIERNQKVLDEMSNFSRNYQEHQEVLICLMKKQKSCRRSE